MDLKEDQDGGLTMSQISGRQEVRNLIAVINPELLKEHSTMPKPESMPRKTA